LYNSIMKIAVIGAGFTGLGAALKLQELGHKVVLFEKADRVGGLAAGFKKPGWDWYLDEAYHHCFISDKTILKMAEKLGQKMIKIKPETNIYIKGEILPIDSPLALLKFPHLPIIDRLRMGFVICYLKYLSRLSGLEGKLALPWLQKTMGKKSTDLIWEPLFRGKFGRFKNDISLTWFWGRIKKRSPVLCYPEGGYQNFTEKIVQRIKKLGGQILLKSEILAISQEPLAISYQTNDKRLKTASFDKVIVTTPTPIFLKIAKGLPKDYIRKLSSIPHLFAQNLILELNKPFLQSSYWLNINDPKSPFLLLAEHTNFMSSKHYGGAHILYIGNYLPAGHPYLKKSARELLQIFEPYLKKINPDYTLNTSRCTLSTLPFAQPVVTVDYLSKIPSFETPIKNIFLANMDMVYPWDRETNYALEMGEKIAEIIDREN